uniref:Uncharacterized protein n=1 Tax=Ananas comosus var. bracteatus TaxID=296719 RepID=A0A6V7QL36_ANACO|nr:unnamed protein product [Ananas comosus var. bracteatus]
MKVKKPTMNALLRTLPEASLSPFSSLASSSSSPFPSRSFTPSSPSLTSKSSSPPPEAPPASLPLRPHLRSWPELPSRCLSSGRRLTSPVVASPPVITSPPIASPALRPHFCPHRRICLLPTPLHSGRTSSHSARSPSPKPLHRRICLLLTPFHSGRTFTAGPKPFPETPSPPDLPPPDAPPLRPKHFTFGPKPFPEAPSPPALPPPDAPSLRSKPFTSGPKPLHIPRSLSPPAKPLHLRLHLRPRPYTSARSPPPPASPTPEAPSCPEGQNRNFLIAAGWTIICPAPCVGRTLCLGLDWPRKICIYKCCGASPIIESSSGSSPGEDDTIAGIRMSACNISSEPFEAVASRCARYANNAEANTSRSQALP